MTTSLPYLISSVEKKKKVILSSYRKSASRENIITCFSSLTFVYLFIQVVVFVIETKIRCRDKTFQKDSFIVKKYFMHRKITH